METREILIGLKCSEEVAAQFEGRKVMVVPLDEWEINELGGNLNGVSDCLGFASLCLIAAKAYRYISPVFECDATSKVVNRLKGSGLFIPRRCI